MPCAYFQCLTAPVELAAIFWFLVVDIYCSEIYKHYKQSPTNILNDQIHYKTHTFFDTIKHSSHNNISAIPTTMKRNIASSSTGTVKHWKWCTWHQKAYAKNSSKSNTLLHREVNLLIQPTFSAFLIAAFLFYFQKIFPWSCFKQILCKSSWV